MKTSGRRSLDHQSRSARTRNVGSIRNEGRMAMKRLVFSLLLALVVSLVYSVAARADRDDQDLSQGVPFENTQTCVQSSGGFNPDFSLRPIPRGGFLNHQTSQSNGFTFVNPDGTRLNTFQSISINHDTVPPGNPISVSEGRCDTGPVETLPDGSTHVNITCTGTITAGNLKDSTFVLTGAGSVSLIDEKTQMSFNTNPYPPRIETETITLQNGFSFTFQRICTKAGASPRVRDRADLHN